MERYIGCPDIAIHVSCSYWQSIENLELCVYSLSVLNEDCLFENGW